MPKAAQPVGGESRAFQPQIYSFSGCANLTGTGLGPPYPEGQSPTSGLQTKVNRLGPGRVNCQVPECLKLCDLFTPIPGGDE